MSERRGDMRIREVTPLMELDSAVESVPGIGPRRAETLRAAGIVTVEDLLLHLPIRYEDRTHTRPVADLEPGVPAAVRGRLRQLRRVGPPRRRRTEAVLLDESGRLPVVWFHQPYLAESLPTDREVLLWGTPERGREEGLRLANPSHVAVDRLERSPHLGRAVPIHRRIGPLGPATLRRLIDAALAEIDQVDEGLPAAVTARAGLLTRREALAAVHYPESVERLAEWNARRSPAHRRLALQEFVAFQTALMLQRRRAREEAGIARALAPSTFEAVLEPLPFALTGAQRRALEEIAGDLRSHRAMHRLLQGDVGSGKTAVAGAAALAVVRAGGQAALLAPTELLARQHERTLGGWARELGLEVGLLTGSSGVAERRRWSERARGGEPFLLVGTHALLEESVDFRRLELAVIDEQHRFGVRQRALLRAKGRRQGAAPDLLVTTATPIPRSLALTLYGDLDVSVIDELPPGRAPVLTRTREPEEWPAMAEELRGRIERGERVYVVSPRIESAPDGVVAATALARALRRRLGEERVGLVHGELAAADRDATMESFTEGRVPVLVATTVIEVGVDVPEATLMIVDHAERFGLAQLHQLRGRVGRGRRRSECWLVGHAPLSDSARRRLAVLCETQDGFRIAEEDLRLRGSGELLGVRQTGPLELRVGDPEADSDWLMEAHAIASELARSDDPEAQAYRRALRAAWRRRMQLLRAG